jgi:hypothetical protein
MLGKRAFTAVALLVALLFSQDFVPLLRAQDAALPTPDELDQLLAPVALYPDSLLAQITTASTNPQEILDVDNWLQQNPNLSGAALTDAAQAAGFDPAFIALVNFPQVVTMMAENVDDYAAIGDAFLADQASVTASIQRLRAQAYASGALRSNEQYQVLHNPAGKSASGLHSSLRSHRGLHRAQAGRRRHIADYFRRWNIDWRAGQHWPAMGLGRLGMELGIEPRILQSFGLGEMGQSLSSAAAVVSPASGVLQQPSRIRRQLGLSPAELPSAESSVPSATE